MLFTPCTQPKRRYIILCLSKRMVQSENIFYKYEICSIEVYVFDTISKRNKCFSPLTLEIILIAFVNQELCHTFCAMRQNPVCATFCIYDRRNCHEGFKQ